MTGTGAPSDRPAAVVIACSTRAARGVYEDRTGPILVEALRSWGFEVPDSIVVEDGPPVGAALRAALAGALDLVLTTGGTGITSRDLTPEYTTPLLDRLVPGIAEHLRAVGVANGVASAVLSRGVAGLAGRTLVVNLPGSRGAVRDALDVLGPLLPHVVGQLRDGDH